MIMSLLPQRYVIHHMIYKTMDKNGEMTLKIDINKAFDRVEWSYLFCVMSKMGFHNKWISLDEALF